MPLCFGRTTGLAIRDFGVRTRYSAKKDIKDKCKWRLNDGGSFTVKGLRDMVDSKILEASGIIFETSWCKFIPKKVCIFVWRLYHRRIPIRVVLDNVGIDLHSVLCPCCEESIESLDHCFVLYPKVKPIWDRVLRWWDVGMQNLFSDEDVLNLTQANIFTRIKKEIWKGIEVQGRAFEWIAARMKKDHLKWEDWINGLIVPSRSMNLKKQGKYATLQLKYAALLEMEPNTSIRRLCPGEDNRVSFNDKVESEGHWDGSEFQDTTNSGEKKVAKAFTFYKMETWESSDRYITPCFVSGLHAYDGDINLENEKIMISNEFAIKVLLDYEVKIVKKGLLVALNGELYFFIFIINPEQDDVEPSAVFGQSFLRLTKGIVDFRNGVITIYPKLESFRDDSDNYNDLGDDWDAILENVDFGDIPQLDGIDVPPYVCNMGKTLRNKKKPCGNYKMTYIEEVRNKHESDSDDEEDYFMKRDEMGKPIYGPNFAKYLNCDDPIDRALAL
ncbi:RNA-directed DNA polymerase, eukaryota, reverse transcriptase zinc-binding domain protein [Tanacetum coccineum]